MTRSVAPVRSQASCHGTMFEWCSIAEISTSSPAERLAWPQLCATRLIPSVALRVKTISCGWAAPRNAAASVRAASNAAVARSDSMWTPRWTLALAVS